MNDVIIEKVSGLGRRVANADGVSGIILNGVSVVGGAQIGTVYRLASLADAVALKIDADYDTDNSVLVYEHLKEIYRVNPNCDLYLLIVAQATTYANMVDVAQADNIMKLRQAGEGSIRLYAVAYNPAAEVADTSALEAAIPKAQEFATLAFTEHEPGEVFLEGKGYDYTSPIDFRALNAPNVTVMVGQSLSIANDEPTYAAVGTLLGAVSGGKVNECIGWVEKYNVFGGSLSVAGISGTAYRNIAQGTLEAIDEDGAVFFRTHTGRAGIYFNDSHTCVEITSDYAYIESNRTTHKAARNIRTALLPKLNSPVLIDTDAGTLDPVTLSVMDNLVRTELEIMANDQEINTPVKDDVYIDPAQDILSTSELKIETKMTPTGTARKITVSLGFKNPITA